MDNLRFVLFVLFVFLSFMLWQQWQVDYGPKPEPTAQTESTVPAAPTYLRPLGRRRHRQDPESTVAAVEHPRQRHDRCHTRRDRHQGGDLRILIYSNIPRARTIPISRFGCSMTKTNFSLHSGFLGKKPRPDPSLYLRAEADTYTW